MACPHNIDRVELGTLATRQPPPEIQARNPHQHRQHTTLRLYTRRIAISAEQTTALECGERAAIAALTDAIEDDLKSAGQNAREVFAFVINRRGAEFTDKRRVPSAS